MLRPGGLHNSRLPNGQTFRAPGLPIEVDGEIPQPFSLDVAGVGNDTQVILEELGLTPSEALQASGVSGRKLA